MTIFSSNLNRLYRLNRLKLVLSITLVLAAANSGCTWALSPAVKVTATAKTAGSAAIKLSEIQNCECVVPNIGNGTDSHVQLKNGHYKSKNDSVNGTEQGSIGSTASGVLKGRPTGFGVLSWNTGGSGNWTAYILFERVKGKVKGVRYYSPEYPANNGWVDNVRVGGDKISFDLNDVAMDFRQAGDDGPAGEANLKDDDSKALSQAELMEANVWLPTPDKLYDSDAMTEKIQLHKGHCQKNGLSCTLSSMISTKVQSDMQTLGLGQVSMGGKTAPLQVAFRFKKVGGKAQCQGYYSLGNKYQARALAKVKGDPGKDSLIVKVPDVTLNTSDFEKPTFSK